MAEPQSETESDSGSESESESDSSSDAGDKRPTKAPAKKMKKAASSKVHFEEDDHLKRVQALKKLGCTEDELKKQLRCVKMKQKRENPTTGEKRPLGAFFLYKADHFAAVNAKMSSPKDTMHELGKMWASEKSKNSEEFLRHKKKAAALKAAYDSKVGGSKLKGRKGM
jgi:hypothetical protein